MVARATRIGETTVTFLLFVVIPALLGGLLAGWTVHKLARAHTAPRRTAWLAVGAFLAVALGWYLTTFIAGAGVICAIIVYLVARARFGGRVALYAASATYLGLTICVGGLLYFARRGMG